MKLFARVFLVTLLLIIAASVVSIPAFAQNELGVPAYPNATAMPDVADRFLEPKGSTWLAAGASRTGHPIKDVVRYVRDQAGKAKKPAVETELVKRLLENNWKVTDTTLGFANEVFGLNKELIKVAKEGTKTTF